VLERPSNCVSPTRSADSSNSRSGVTEARALEIAPSRLAGLRRRTVVSLMAGVALGSTGHIAAVTVATIVAKEIAGSTIWSGAPGASVVLGAAIGSTLLSRLMASRGRRAGLTMGYIVGLTGAGVATFAVIGRSLPLLLLGTVMIGFGNSSNQLSRYAAADLIPMALRASAIGLVVWGATFGAVLGPNLVGWAGEISTGIGLPALAGAYLIPVVFVGAAAFLSFALLRPDPYELADRSEDDPAGAGAGQTSLERILRRPHVPAAIAALVAGQFVMTLVMTMTPLHMSEHGHGLAAVGLVISGHTFGMFALSPISGRLTDRFGTTAVVMAGLIVTGVAALLSAVAPPDGGPLLFLSLFLIGYGWNLGFVAGSALLTHGLELAERTRLQGTTDALIWSSAAAASLGSGVMVAVAGFTSLGLIGAAAVVVPALLVLARRRAAGAEAG
jgi:MFS family permease